MNEWQPIETAPKNGTKVLLLSKFDIYIGHWNTDDYSKKKIPHWHFGHGIFSKTYLLQIQPTHWMPLPSIPKEIIGE